MKNNQLITFFHCTYQHINEFSPQYEKRPVFYWFSDRFHNHINVKYRERYFYLFIKNTKAESIRFMARCGNGDFDSVYRHYLDYIKKGKFDDVDPQPGILMSHNRGIKPDFVAEFPDPHGKSCRVIFPEEYKGWELKLFDDQDVPVRFTEVPELTRILPDLPYSIPLSKPKLIGNKYTYSNWLSYTKWPMYTYAHG